MLMKWLTKFHFGVVMASLLLLISPFSGSALEKPAAALETEDFFIVLQEDFEGEFPPVGWSVIDNAGTGNVWARNDAAGVPNYCAHGDGFAAAVHPDETNTTRWNTELRTPPIDLTGASVANLEYASHFQDYNSNGESWLDISTDNGASWTNLRYQTEDDPPGGNPAVGGTLVTRSITAFTGHVIILRWRYSASSGPAWMWHIDSIKLTAVGENGAIFGKIHPAISESFEGDVPPAGWAAIDNASTGMGWLRNDAANEYNYCQYGSGYAAGAHAGDENTMVWDTELRSPPIDLTQALWAQVEYASYFQNFAGNGRIWLDISTDAGASWTNLRFQTEDDPPGGTPMWGGTLETEDLSAFIGNVVQLRWRYQANAGPAWLWQIDDVIVSKFTPLPRLSESSLNAPRFLPPGQPADFNTIIHLNESTAVSGFHWAWTISMTDPLPESVIYQPGSLWCSQGACRKEDTVITWEDQFSNRSDAFLVYSVDVPSPTCGTLITNTAVFTEPNLDTPLSLTAVTGIWQDIWLDEALNNFPPSGWSVNDFGGSAQPGSVFTADDPGSRGNRTGGPGGFAIVDNAAAGEGIPVETDLRLPPIEIPIFLRTALVLKSDFVQEGGAARAEVQISLDGGGAWETLLFWDGDQPGPRTTIIDLSPYAGEANALIRFYYDDNGSDAGWWALDDIQVTGCPGLVYFPLITHQD